MRKCCLFKKKKITMLFAIGLRIKKKNKVKSCPYPSWKCIIYTIILVSCSNLLAMYTITVSQKEKRIRRFPLLLRSVCPRIRIEF